MSSLLAHLASKFTDQQEVVATDALAFILRTSAPATKALAHLLGACVGEDVPVARVSPQYFAGNESRPDLATFGPNDALSALIEAKFWAGLTDAQPLEYLRRLRQHGGRALLFVVPDERVPAISASVAERARCAEFPVWIASSGTSSGPPQAAPTAVRLSVTSWKRLLTVLTDECIRAEDRPAVANLDQLSALVARFEAEGFGPMSPAELTDLSLPRRMRALAALAQAVIAKGEATELIQVLLSI